VEGRRGREYRGRTAWSETISENLRGLGLTWEDALDAGDDMDGQMDAGNGLI